MRILNRLILIIPIAFISVNGVSQNNLVLFHLKDFDNTGFFRPNSIKNDYNVQIAFLPFGFTTSLYSTFSIANAFTKTGNLYVSDLDKLYGRLKTRNFISQESNLPVFDIKVWTYYGQFEFGIRDNFNSLIPIDREAVKFLNEGNASYVGQKFSSSINAEMVHFREFFFGYIHDNLEDLWSYGVRMKILMGMGMIRTNIDYSIETGEDVEYIGLSVSGDTKVSFPLSKSYDENGFISDISVSDCFSPAKYFLGAGNFGLGLDLSARYEGVKDWEFEVCAENLGVINWSRNLNSMDAGGNYIWKGLELSNILSSPGLKEFLDEVDAISVKDSIFSNLKIEDNKQPFTTVIPGSILFSAKYLLNKKIDMALVDRLFYSNRFIQNSIALSGNFKIGQYFALSTGFLIKGNTLGNIMLGCGISKKNISFFMGSDNIAAFLLPVNAKNFSFGFGLSYRFIHRTRIAKKLIRNMPFYRPSRF